MGNNPSSTLSPKARRKGSLRGNLVQGTKDRVEDNYNIVEEAIGKGTSTQIRRATMKKYHKTERTRGVAIKLYDGKAEMPPDFKLEAEILGQCDHPNIIKLFEVSKVGKQMSLILELCSGGKLMDRAPFQEKDASHIVRQLCSAVAYLHKKNIVHRDIECDNILFASPAEDSDIKLIDFGCATKLQLVPDHPGAFKFLREKTGSLHIMAPEVVKGRYGPKADVWSIGIVTYMLLNNGKKPFNGSSAQDMERKILQGYIDFRGWQHSDNAKEFIQETAMVNAGLRHSAGVALKHPWLERRVASWALPSELVVSFDLFRIAPPLKRIALNALAIKAPPSTYRSLFRDLDTTESGTLTREEFMTGFRHSGNSPEELNDLFAKLDVNCNGEIMYTEFLAATLEAEGELEEAQLQEAFDMLSQNSKYITKKNVQEIVGNAMKKNPVVNAVKKQFKGDGAKKKRSSQQEDLKFAIDKIFQTKERYNYDDFALLFEHGFDANRSMDAIIETSLNEEQLRQLKEDDLEKHLMTIRETEE